MPPAVATPEITKSPRRFEHLLLEFLAYLELERGLSRNTLNAYRTDLLQYGAYLEDRDLDAGDVTPSIMAEYAAEMASGQNGHKPAASTVHRKTAALRSFYKHLRREELISGDPTAGMVSPRRSKKLPNVLNQPRWRSCLLRRKVTRPRRVAIWRSSR